LAGRFALANMPTLSSDRYFDPIAKAKTRVEVQQDSLGRSQGVVDETAKDFGRFIQARLTANLSSFSFLTLVTTLRFNQKNSWSRPEKFLSQA